MVQPINRQAIAQQSAQAVRQATGTGRDFGHNLRAPQSLGAIRAPGRAITLLHAQRLANWAPLIRQNAAKYGVPLELICGVMLQESGGNPTARSHCGATGLMQLMPATARRFGVTNIQNPAQNVEGGVRYLRYLTDYFHGDVRKVVAAYNSGEGNVTKYGGIPPFKETQNYVPSVLGFAQTIGQMLRGTVPPMRQMIRTTMPRHAVANFSATDGPTNRPRPLPVATAAQRLARI